MGSIDGNVQRGSVPADINPTAITSQSCFTVFQTLTKGMAKRKIESKEPP
jgi:hypothetical protein